MFALIYRSQELDAKCPWPPKFTSYRLVLYAHLFWTSRPEEEEEHLDAKGNFSFLVPSRSTSIHECPSTFGRLLHIEIEWGYEEVSCSIAIQDEAKEANLLVRSCHQVESSFDSTKLDIQSVSHAVESNGRTTQIDAQTTTALRISLAPLKGKVPAWFMNY